VKPQAKWGTEDWRADEDRRVMSRSGRRESDPTPLCPSCGLPQRQPHGSDAECIAALREQIERQGAATDGELHHHTCLHPAAVPNLVRRCERRRHDQMPQQQMRTGRH